MRIGLPSHRFLYFLALITVTGCATEEAPLRDTIDLGGEWAFHADTAEVSGWNTLPFSETVTLPGSLDENKKGRPNTDTTEMHLNREYIHVGPAWYQREVEIPNSWEGKRVELIMERSKVTRVWVDSVSAGFSENLFTPQVYDLTGLATPGRHTLTILVNNDPALVPVEGSHAYSENTQTNWNGILGAFRLEASNPLRIRAVRVFPEVEARRARVEVRIQNPDEAIRPVRLHLKADAWNTDTEHDVPAQVVGVELVSADTSVVLEYDLGDGALLWSEFDPALYRLVVTLLEEEEPVDEYRLDFGMRKFSTRGTQFTINDVVTFLRGKHDGGVFPLTGYPPMDTTSWARYFRIARSYGINHVRFHSWTPPEAAFAAADVAGVYLQPETPIWYGFNATDSTQMAFMMREGKNILDAYGNHASFVMFALGNEIGQDRALLKGMVDELRAHDPRRLYAQGSNNRGWDPSYAEGDDYWTTFRTGPEQPDLSTDVRASISFLDSEEGGILNAVYPSTNWTYERAISRSPVPVIGHEIGQYQIYPNYAEMEKYTGVLKPWNFEIFHRRLAEKGMLDQADDFFQASGAFSAICYRADIEIALRTPGMGGFQLLDLQDYPGQGTALVGILDAFMDSKGLIEPEAFRRFNDEVVLLLRMDKYTWENDEPFRAEVQVANYSPGAIDDATVRWRARIAGGDSTFASGTFGPNPIPQGGITSLGTIELDLGSLDDAQKIEIDLALERTPYETSYPAWVYPAEVSTEVPEGVTVATQLDEVTLGVLQQGGRVVLFPEFEQIEEQSVGGQFIPEFWNYGMFTSLAYQYGDPETDISMGTMGILTDPGHAIFRRFPTEFHSNWQWWPIVKNSRPVILDETAESYRPIVQVIDNINRNHKLGLVFEYRVGEGRLLVVSSNLPGITRYPEARQLYASVLEYAASDAFAPSEAITIDALRELLYGR